MKLTKVKYFRLLRLLSFFCLGGLVGIVFLGLISFFAAIGIKEKYSGKVYPNVYLRSAILSGKTESQLKQYLESRNKSAAEKKITFYWENQDRKQWKIDPLLVGFALDEKEIVEEAMGIGRSPGGLWGIKETYRLMIFPRVIEPKYVFDEGKIEKIISEIGSAVDLPVQEARFEFKDGKVVEFQESKDGLQLNTDEVKRLIVDTFSNIFWQENSDETKDKIEIALPVVKITSKVNTSQTNRLGIEELLGEGESYFSGSAASRIYNIALASSRFHGVIIEPGEVFSFSKNIGEISAATGYQKAYVIKEKKTILEDGGGVCQVSTTLFRAALNAGLPIIERQAHYYRVGFYEEGGFPPGLDATVYPPSPDLKIKNDTLAYLLIQVEVDKAKKHLVFKLYGTNDGRKVDLTKPTVHSQTAPPEPLYIDEPTLALGVVNRMDVAHWGARVSFSRQVFNSDGTLKEDKTFWSNYTAWPAVYQRGTGAN